MKTPTSLTDILAKLPNASHSFKKALADNLRAIEDNNCTNGTPVSSAPSKPLESQGKAISEDSTAFQDYCVAAGLPPPVSEFRFAPPRRFRFDYSWESERVALEVNGGVWSRGRHTRGAGFIRDMEKASLAATLGWRILYCQPKDLMTPETLALICRALEFRMPL